MDTVDRPWLPCRRGLESTSLAEAVRRTGSQVGLRTTRLSAFARAATPPSTAKRSRSLEHRVEELLERRALDERHREDEQRGGDAERQQDLAREQLQNHANTSPAKALRTMSSSVFSGGMFLERA